MKRILSGFVTLVIMLCTMAAFAASGSGEITVRPVGAGGNMKISIILPDEFIDREIYVYILNPGMDISMLTDNNATQNSKVFQFGGQKAYAAGGIEFNFKMNTDNVNAELEPVYKVYANAITGESFTFDFSYYDIQKKEELVTVIKNKQVTAGTAEPVSYTHLDVYKRQVYNTSDSDPVTVSPIVAAGENASLQGKYVKVLVSTPEGDSYESDPVYINKSWGAGLSLIHI